MENPDAQRPQTCCPIVELRQYTLHPGKREVLIDLFDREFVESQEALGMKVIGQFRDLDNPNRFVWLRGFRDMPSRAQALKDFYGGPVWKAHREAANTTMIDSDNVLLLHPATPTSGFVLSETGHALKRDRTRSGANRSWRRSIISMRRWMRARSTFEKTVKPVLIGSGATILASFVTEHSENTFPALPVREGENVFVGSRASTIPPHMSVTLLPSTGAAMARCDCERTDAATEPGAGDLEIIADDPLSFL